MGSSITEPRLEPSSSGLAPGTIVGDYRIDRLIGSGGMGAVYEATQPMIGKHVALKVLHRSKSQTAVSRFVKEARAVNLIGHPNIVDVFGFGTTEDGRAYLVMELLLGETLAVRTKRGPISLAEICNVLIEVTHALEAVHEANIIHRDLKPENIFLARRRNVMTVKLLDFGIAKLLGPEPGLNDETRPGILIGTPRYISPEQVSGKPLDGASDVYTLGVVAFELMAGRTPFVGDDSFELFEKHAKLKPPKLSAFNADIPPAADALVAAMLAKDPAERPSLAVIRAALETLRTMPAANVAAAPSRATVQATDVHAVESGEPVTESRTNIAAVPAAAGRLRRLALPAGLAAAAVVGVVIAAVLARGHGGEDHAVDDHPATQQGVALHAQPAGDVGSATAPAQQAAAPPAPPVDTTPSPTTVPAVPRHANAPRVRHERAHAAGEANAETEISTPTPTPSPTRTPTRLPTPSPTPTPEPDSDQRRRRGAKPLRAQTVTRVAIVVALLAARVAMAGPDPQPGSTSTSAADASAIARDADRAAHTYYDAHDYPAAIAEYRRAFAALPDALFLFDIAQAYRQLHDCDHALAFYRDYLAARPDADNRPRVEHFITEMEACATPPATTVTTTAPVIERPNGLRIAGSQPAAS